MIFTVVLALALSAAAEKDDWATLTSKEGKFKAWLPTSATTKTQKAAGLTLHLVGTEGPSGATSVVYVDLPGRVAGQQRDDLRVRTGP